jgi:protein-disulfide isomerase
VTNRWATYKSVLETIALVVVAIAVVYKTVADRPTRASDRPTPSRTERAAPPLPVEPISLEGAPTSGSPTAKVALVVYSDFQCPFCARFARETLPTLEQQYVATGKVLLAFRQFPLDIHPLAAKAAEGSLCAARQGKFWPFHDALFGSPQGLDASSLLGHAERLGLNQNAFAECLSGQTAANVASDRQGGQTFAITGTPTFLVGPLVAQGRVKISERFSGALPLAQFQAKLDDVLRRAGVP